MGGFTQNPNNLAGGAPPPDTINTGLVSHWKLNSNVLDSYGSNNGTASGGLTYEAAKLSNGAVLTNVGDGVTALGGASTFNFIHQTSIFTINFWVKTTDFNQGYPIGNRTSNKGFNFGQFNNEGEYNTTFSLGQSGIGSVDNITIVTSDLFNPYLALTMLTIIGDGTNIKLYHDTTLIQTIAKPSATITGDADQALEFNLDGLAGCTLDDVAIWNIEKTTYLSDLYNGGAGLDF